MFTGKQQGRLGAGWGTGLEVTLNSGLAGGLPSPTRTMGFLPARRACIRSRPTMHRFALSPRGPRSPDLRESVLPCLHQELLCWRLSTKRPTPPCLSHCPLARLCARAYPSLRVASLRDLGGHPGSRERHRQAQALVPKQCGALRSRASGSGCPARTPAAFPCQFCEFRHTNLS